MTQYQLSVDAGVQVMTISKLERGLHPPSLAVLEKVAGALGEPVSALLEQQQTPAALDDRGEAAFEEFLAESPLAHGLEEETIQRMRAIAGAFFAGTSPTRASWEHLCLALQKARAVEVAEALGAQVVTP